MFLRLKKLALITVAGLSFSIVVAPSVSLAKVIDGGTVAPTSTTSPQKTATSTQQAASTNPNNSAQNDIQCGINQATGGDCSATSNPPSDLSTTIKKVLNILSALAGLLAVIMITVAGFRLVASAGSEEGVKKAKSSIIYAVVGIVIVAVAQVLVHFVITNIA